MGFTHGAFPKSTEPRGYTNAAYADDKQDRESSYGYVILLAGGPVAWASRKQRSVATSTTEAE